MSTELFPGFSADWIDIPRGRFFARSGGPEHAAPVILLHGFPQTHACWHRIAPTLAETRRVVCLDLKGYGWSEASEGDSRHDTYSKRSMGRDVVAIMEHLGHVRFALVGHDRGARVGYRLALDEPGRIERLALLDILPTIVQWERIRADPTVSSHWDSLARPAPLPEEEIGRDPVAYFEGLLRQWSNAKSLEPFAPEALRLYRENWIVPERVHAFCEDYRAGATRDREADLDDLSAGKTVSCPTLILTGDGYLDHSFETPLAAWQRTFAPKAKAVDLTSGHFVAEENVSGTLEALRIFFCAGELASPGEGTRPESRS